ncbi:apolipoprotein N-acyltransferase [Azospirillum griseum]|nr:apolipoprotein N-acyltransferase [Azospirillum griseum]
MIPSDTPVGLASAARARAALMALSGRRRWLAAMALGGLATFALPPAYALPVLLVAFPGLIWLLEGAARGRSAFAIGWCFGFGHHLLGLYWISAALFTDIHQFWWALPFSAVGLPVLLGLFAGVAGWLFHALRVRGAGGGVASACLFAAAWGLMEWVRGHAFTGFPWNLIGYGWVGVLPVLQGVSLVGIYGLSLLTVLVAALPAALADPLARPRRAWGALVVGLAALALLGGWGGWRLATASDAVVPGVRLRLVQAAIDQRLKWAEGQREQNVRENLELSALPAPEPVTHILWPETTVPFFIERDARVRQALASVTPSGGLLITGAPRSERTDDNGWRYFNSLVAVDGSGAVVGSYDKAHLVPFGEYMPLRRWIPVDAIASNGAEFSPGPGPRTLTLPGLPPVSPLICYEGIFPGAVADPVERPRWLLNLTNDAWYGHTAGPYQHFAINQVRAVEEGMPLVRVANTGISGLVDAYGRVRQSLGLGERGIIDTTLPKAPDETTLYSRAGDVLFGFGLLACFLVAIFSRSHSPRSRFNDLSS